MQTPNGYVFQTTFVDDFRIADVFGKNAIQDTYNRAFKEWADNYIYLTELVIALNWGIWDWYNKDESIALLYDDLWNKTNEYALKTLKSDELTYYLRTID